MIVRTPLKPVFIQQSLPFDDAPKSRPIFYYDKPGWDDRHIEAKVDVLIAQGYPIPENRYPLLKGYNGATGWERRQGGTKWKIAQQNRLVPYPTVCSVCGSTRNLQCHNENYFRPLNAKPVCSSCHRLLHRRFFDPNPWLAVSHDNQYEGAWFRNIALHPLSTEQARYLATLDDPIDVRQLM